LFKTGHIKNWYCHTTGWLR